MSTAVSFWGHSEQILSSLSPKWDCGPKRVNLYVCHSAGGQKTPEYHDKHSKKKKGKRRSNQPVVTMSTATTTTTTTTTTANPTNRSSDNDDYYDSPTATTKTTNNSYNNQHQRPHFNNTTPEQQHHQTTTATTTMKSTIKKQEIRKPMALFLGGAHPSDSPGITTQAFLSRTPHESNTRVWSEAGVEGRRRRRRVGTGGEGKKKR